MPSKLLCSCLCLSLALGLGLPASTEAAPPTETAAPERASPVELGLEIDTSKIDEEFQRQLELVVLQQLTPALENAGYAISSAAPELTLRVRFTPTEAGRFRDHGIHFELVRGEEVEPAIQWVLCEGCVQVRLEEKLAAATPELIEALDGATESAATNPDDGPPGTEPIEPPPPVLKPLGPLGGVGIGVAALGLGAVAWGAVDLARGRVYDDVSTPELTTRRPGTDFHPRGRALLASGIAGVVVGGALLATDLVLRYKQRRQAQRNAGIFVPVLAPEQLGLGWIKRF